MVTGVAISLKILSPKAIERLSELGPVAHLVGLLCLFAVFLARIRRSRREAFWPAVASGLIGVLIGGGLLIAGMRVLGLKVLNRSDFQRLERQRGNWQGNTGAGGRTRMRGGAPDEQGKLGLVALIRRLDTLTAGNPAFLEDHQARAVLSLLEMVLPMPGFGDQEATEMSEDLARRFTEPQRQQIRAAAMPANTGLFGPGGWLANPLQGELNRAAVMALIARYDHLERTVLTPLMLDF